MYQKRKRTMKDNLIEAIIVILIIILFIGVNALLGLNIERGLMIFILYILLRREVKYIKENND